MSSIESIKSNRSFNW